MEATMNPARAAGQPQPMVAPIWLTAPASRPRPAGRNGAQRRAPARRWAPWPV